MGANLLLIRVEHLPFTGFATLIKGKGHNYIKRELTGKPKPKYRYWYRLPKGKIVHRDNVKVGAKFRHGKGEHAGHFEITEVTSETRQVGLEYIPVDVYRIKHDETGEERLVSQAELEHLIHAGDHELGESPADKTARLFRDYKQVLKTGTDKQVKRIRDHLDEHLVAYGNVNQAQIVEDTVLTGTYLDELHRRSRQGAFNPSGQELDWGEKKAPEDGRNIAFELPLPPHYEPLTRYPKQQYGNGVAWGVKFLNTADIPADNQVATLIRALRNIPEDALNEAHLDGPIGDPPMLRLARKMYSIATAKIRRAQQGRARRGTKNFWEGVQDAAGRMMDMHTVEDIADYSRRMKNKIREMWRDANEPAPRQSPRTESTPNQSAPVTKKPKRLSRSALQRDQSLFDQETGEFIGNPSGFYDVKAMVRRFTPAQMTAITEALNNALSNPYDQEELEDEHRDVLESMRNASINSKEAAKLDVVMTQYKMEKMRTTEVHNPKFKRLPNGEISVGEPAVGQAAGGGRAEYRPIPLDDEKEIEGEAKQFLDLINGALRRSGTTGRTKKSFATVLKNNGLSADKEGLSEMKKSTFQTTVNQSPTNDGVTLKNWGSSPHVPPSEEWKTRSPVGASPDMARIPINQRPQHTTTPWPVENRDVEPFIPSPSRNYGTGLFRRYPNGDLDFEWAKSVVDEAIRKSKIGLPLQEFDALSLSAVFPEITFKGLPAQIVDIKARLSKAEKEKLRQTLHENAKAVLQSMGVASGMA